jgi:glc operon protein GlcG
MKHKCLRAVAIGLNVLMASAAFAQQAAPPQSPLDVVPEKLAFNIPYGAPISLERAEAVISAAVAEASKHGWPLNVAVVDSAGNPIAFRRMDGAILAGITISEKKARAAVFYRRPTKAFQDAAAVQAPVFNVFLTLDGVVASAGGIPLVEDGKIIGAIGCSGGSGSQDEVVAKAGVAVIDKK